MVAVVVAGKESMWMKYVCSSGSEGSQLQEWIYGVNVFGRKMTEVRRRY